MKDEIIKFEDKDGNIKEYIVLLVFKWYRTNKFYIVYTDTKRDLNEEYNIYANIFNPNDLNELEDVKTEEEWNEIESRLKDVKGMTL